MFEEEDQEVEDPVACAGPLPQEAPTAEIAKEVQEEETPVEERPFKLTLQYLEQHENELEALKKAYDAFEVEALDPAIEAYNEAEAKLKIEQKAARDSKYAARKAQQK
jgi:hypothetical protein